MYSIEQDNVFLIQLVETNFGNFCHHQEIVGIKIIVVFD
jgi:hypothetical protein